MSGDESKKTTWFSFDELSLDTQQLLKAQAQREGKTVEALFIELMNSQETRAALEGDAESNS